MLCDRDRAPWTALRGEANVDVLDGPTQIVVTKRPLLLVFHVFFTRGQEKAM